MMSGQNTQTLIFISGTEFTVTGSGVNDRPVCGFSFVSGKNNKICKEYLGTGH